nr:MAG TPA: hypothetical protein [Caudoviricetes sp.]
MTKFLFSIIALCIILVGGLGLGFTIASLGDDYSNQETVACEVMSYTLDLNGYNEVCVEAKIDQKLTDGKDFFHGYAIISSGEEVEFWLLIDGDQTRMKMEAPSASSPVTELERRAGPADGVRI